jgi:hypothetical protein
MGNVMSDWKEPRQYALVKFDFDSFPEAYRATALRDYPFKEKIRYIYLGEIPNFQGHCIVMDDNGKHYVGYHTDNFVELDDEYHGDSVTCELDEYSPIKRHVGS